MKKNILWRVAALLSLLVCALLGGCGYGNSSFWTDVIFPNESEYAVGNGSVTETVESISLEWVNGEVCIVYYDGATIEISETKKGVTSDDLLLRYRAKDSTLDIRYAKNGRWNIFNVEKDLTVKIPAGTQLKNVTIDCVSANVSLDGLAVNELAVQTVSGEIESTATIRADRCTLNTVSANVTLSLRASEVFLDTVSGNTTLLLPAGVNSTVSFETVSGVLRNGKNEPENSFLCSITAETVSGNLTLKNE